MTNIKNFHKTIRNHPICDHLIPTESNLSYPVPLLKDGKMYLRFFFFNRSRPDHGGKPGIFRPFARISAHYPSARIVEFVDLGFLEGKPETPNSETVTVVSSTSLDSLNFSQVVQKQKEFFNITEAIFSIYGSENLTQEEHTTIGQYKELFDLLVDKGLISHYKVLNPIFFDWLERI